jgi:lipopolysaccharide transport system permease protein
VNELARAAWRYRYFIVSSVRNELKSRFVRSRLGGLWMIIHPLAQVLIFALILSEVLSAKLPGVNNKHAYALYLMAGTVAWSLFSDGLSRCLTLFIDNGNLMKKMAFPRICLPLIAAGAAVVNNLLLILAVFAVFAALGHWPGAHAGWLPVLLVITLVLSIGIGLVLGVVNVFVRDVGQVVPVVLQILFWLTPIVYTIDIIPASLRRWLEFNPMYPLVSSYQAVLVFDRAPDWRGLAVTAVTGVVMLGLALLIFRRASAEMVDAL